MTRQAPPANQIGSLINILKILIKVVKYLPLIVVSFACLSIALAVNDFVRGNLAWGIINSAFALSGLIFFVQLYQRRNIHPFESAIFKKREIRIIATTQK